MNRRQQKKQFKKRFGFNPPRNIPIQTATKIIERRESIIAETEILKATILNLWEIMREPLLQFVAALKEHDTAFITSATMGAEAEGSTTRVANTSYVTAEATGKRGKTD